MKFPFEILDVRVSLVVEKKNHVNLLEKCARDVCQSCSSKSLFFDELMPYARPIIFALYAHLLCNGFIVCWKRVFPMEKPLT